MRTTDQCAVGISLRHQGSLRSLVRRPTALLGHRQPDHRRLRPGASTAACGPHATATTIRPRKGNHHSSPATERRPGPPAPLSTRLPGRSGRSRIDGRAQRGGAGRPPPRCLMSPPRLRRAVRPSPHAAAKTQHGHGAQGDPNSTGQRRFVLPAGGRIVVAVACGPTLADAPAFIRPADPTPGQPAGRRAQPCNGEKPSVAGAVGSATLASHFGASLADHGPNVVLYRAGPQTARRAGSLRGHDHSRQSSSRPKSLHRPCIA